MGCIFWAGSYEEGPGLGGLDSRILGFIGFQDSMIVGLGGGFFWPATLGIGFFGGPCGSCRPGLGFFWSGSYGGLALCLLGAAEVGFLLLPAMQ